ncbi:hypothetical protein BDZ89DRAFT_1114132 [Hymenopellis radicata]|nr:hypothetical protein BDZ89DRAFT_1114132 [Hymenopellis radicata]
MSSNAEVLGMSDTDVVNALGATLNGTVIETLGYGVYVTIFISALLAHGTRWPRQRVALTVVVCLIWVLATLHLGIWWRGAYRTYVTHTQTRDAMLGFLMGIGEGNWTSSDAAFQIISWTAVALNALIADITNIWRCWTLYRRDWRVVVLPGLGVILALISHAFNMTVLYYPPTIDVDSLSINNVRVNWNTMYYAVTAATNLFTTSLIIFRIFSVVGIKNSRTYRGLIEILVESALLYSVTYITYLGVFARENGLSYWRFGNWYLEAFLNAVTAAAPTMIIRRVMSGETRPDDGPFLPSMGNSIRSFGNSIGLMTFRPPRRQAETVAVDLVDESVDGHRYFEDSDIMLASMSGTNVQQKLLEEHYLDQEWSYGTFTVKLHYFDQLCLMKRVCSSADFHSKHV